MFSMVELRGNGVYKVMHADLRVWSLLTFHMIQMTPRISSASRTLYVLSATPSSFSSLEGSPIFLVIPRTYSLVFPLSALASYLSLGCNAGMQPTLSGLYNLVLLRISSYMIFHTLPVEPVSLPLQISLLLPRVAPFEPTFRSNIPSWVSVCICIHCLYPINCTNSETLGKECELELVH